MLFNNAPLWLAPLYANASEGGVGDNKYWADKPANLTAISLKMEEEVTSVNQIFNFQLPFEKLVANRYPGANFALYNVNQLVSRISSRILFARLDSQSSVIRCSTSTPRLQTFSTEPLH